MPSTTRVDFHCHSNQSDGYYAPTTLAEKLADAGVHYAALTDHDSLEGLPEFHRAAARRGMVAVEGVEVFAACGDRTLHVLAYGFNPTAPALRTLFDRVAPVDEVIARIHDDGGKAFLAHPLQVDPQLPALERILADLARLGLDGVETWYAAYTEHERRRLAESADRLGLLKVAGSDFHGPALSGPREPGVEMPREDWKAFRTACMQGGGGRDETPARKPRRGAPAAPAPRPRLSRFLLGIVLPAILAVGLFMTFLFAYLIPAMEESLVARKRELIRELTNSAWSILAEYEREARAGRLTRDEAQAAAVERIRYMRYGSEGKDYFWVTDMQPRMVVHPYRPELEGKDLSHFRDPDGVALFVEFVRKVREKGSGYVDYVWQWKDDPEHLAAKESYVRGFEPWGWVIGTGIYIRDVDLELHDIMGRVIDASAVIGLIVAALVLIVAHQSYRIERRRREAERELRVSHEKYRTLVESASEGTLMVVDERCTYANRTMLELIDCNEQDLALLDIHDLLPMEGDAPETTRRALRRLLESDARPEPFETSLRRADGSSLPVHVSASRVSVGGRPGLVINARDIGGDKALQTELGASRERYRALAEGVDIGVFRTEMEGRAPFVELNAAGRRILGFSEAPLPEGAGLRDVLADADAAEVLFNTLRNQESLKDSIHQVRRADGELVTVSLSAMLVRDDAQRPRFCDGVMEDVSERRRAETDREDLLAQMQTSLLFLNEPVRNSMTKLLTCDLDTPIHRAADLMSRGAYSAIAVLTPEGEVAGLVTDADLRKRVVAAAAPIDQPVFRIMTAPVADLPDSAPVYEALLLMDQRRARHLVVRDGDGKPVGIVRNQELVRFGRYSPVLITREIQQAATPDEIGDVRRRLAPLVGSLVDSGALPRNIARITTTVSDATVERVLDFAIADLGEPPCRYAFLALGSEGREEQTLATDQDNAVVYQPASRREAETARQYFLALGEKACGGLAQAGYALCKGDMMARNPRWNQTLDAWKKTFADWIAEPDSDQLLHFNIFFDFRCVGGDPALASELHDHIQDLLRKQPGFYPHLARNTLHYKPPVGMFGQILTGADGAPPNTFDIKDAALPVVNFARLYALHENVDETNTLDRLERLHAAGVLHADSYREIRQAYRCLLELRLKHQVRAMRAGRQPDNALNPKALTQIEAGMLKESFTQIAAIQKKVSFDFPGAA